LSIGPYLSGEPADVVTNSTPSSTIIGTMSGSRRKANGRLTPNGFAVSSRIRRMSRRVASVPSEPGMRPIAPASDTAATSGGWATYPIGAWKIGTSTPSSCVTRLSKRMAGTLAMGRSVSDIIVSRD
jgi:hypothetical protein